MAMRRAPARVARHVDFPAAGWSPAAVALLRHSTLPWTDRPDRAAEIDTDSLETASSWGERDRLSLLSQLAAHLAFVRAAGLGWGRFNPEDWGATRKRTDDARLLRVALRAEEDESAAAFLARAAETLRVARLPSLKASWVKPDCVYAEIDARLRGGPRAHRWLRDSAVGRVLPPGLTAATHIAAGRPERLSSEEHEVLDALAILSRLTPHPLRTFEIGGVTATPLRPFSGVASLGEFSGARPGDEAAAFDRVEETIPPAAILLVRDGSRLDESSTHLLRLLASARRDLSWVVAGEVPISLARLLEAERVAGTFFVVSPSMTARLDVERAMDEIPPAERAGWLRSFARGDRYGLFLDEGIVPPAASAGASEEPRRSYLGALAVAGQRVPSAVAASILRELGWLSPATDLAVPGLVTIGDDGVEFHSAAIREAIASSLPSETRTGLCALAAAAFAQDDPWRAALLRLEAGDASAAKVIQTGGPLDDRRRSELLSAIARFPQSVRPRPEINEIHVTALIDTGRYRLARQEAERLPDEARRLSLARIERRLGHYAAAEASLATLLARKRAGSRALVAAAEIARLRGDELAALALLERSRGEGGADSPAAAYERALLAVDGGRDVDPGDVAALASAPYLGGRLATYLALARRDFDAASAAAAQAIRDASTPLERIDAMLDLFYTLFLAGEWDAARIRARECLALVEETDGDRAAGGVLFTLGYLFADRGEWTRAEDALARLRTFYAGAEDLRRLRETTLVAAHLAFARGRYAEARAHVAELDFDRLSAEEREAALLIVDEIDTIEGLDAPMRSAGSCACRELTDRHLLLRSRRGLDHGEISNPFLRDLAAWETAVRHDRADAPPGAAGPSQSLILLRALRAARRRGADVGALPDRVARELGVEAEAPPVAAPAIGELEILQRVASLPFPFLPSDLAGHAWLFARRNRLGVWNHAGSIDPPSSDELDALLASPRADWLQCSDDAVLYLEGTAGWSEGSRRSLASLFLIRNEHWSLKRAIDQGTTIAESREEEPGGVVGESRAMQELFATVRRIARRDVAVCIEGESGAGKELVARAIHDASPRRAKPFVALNCAALPDNLIESELFGHARGAFTGADRDRPGLIEAADGGTLFLDEIGEMPTSAQAKLLRFLQESEFRRVGESATRRADVRVVTATNRRLESEVDKGRFREDLYYRIRGVELRVPPLRERGGDILLLARHFLAREHRRHGGAAALSDDVEAVLAAYSWPGNVRELEHALRSAHAFAGDASVVELEHLSPRIRQARAVRRPNGNYYDEVTRFRRALVERSLADSEGNQARAAKLLGISRQALAYQIRELGVLIEPRKK